MRKELEFDQNVWDKVNEELSLYDQARNESHIDDRRWFLQIISRTVRVINPPRPISIFNQTGEYLIADDSFAHHYSLWRKYNEKRKSMRLPPSTWMVSGQVFSFKNEPNLFYIRLDLDADVAPSGTSSVVIDLIDQGYIVLGPEYTKFDPIPK